MVTPQERRHSRQEDRTAKKISSGDGSFIGPILCRFFVVCSLFAVILALRQKRLRNDVRAATLFSFTTLQNFIFSLGTCRVTLHSKRALLVPKFTPFRYSQDVAFDGL